MRSKTARTAPFRGAMLVGALGVALVCGSLAGGQQPPAKDTKPASKDKATPPADQKPTPAKSGDPNTERYAAMAEASFRALDKNGDGRLEYNEMPEDLRAELSKWDTNKNGTIELDEYKAYFIAKREQRKPEKPAVLSLQELLTLALKENPDVRVAEIKLREAEADLNRTRLQVIRKVVALHQALKNQQAQIEAAEASYQIAESTLKGITQLYQTGRVTQPEVNEKRAALETAKAALVTAKAALAQTEAELPYVLGKYPQASPSDAKSQDARRLYLQAISQAQKQFDEWANAEALKGRPPAGSPPVGAIADKIRKALSMPVKAEFEGASLDEVITGLNDGTGISFQIKGFDLAKTLVPVRLRAKEAVPLVAVLQAIEDVLPKVRFVVRDYGILVAEVDALPPGAISVEQFWKTPPTQAKPAAGAEPSRKESAPEGVNGTIQNVDPKSGVVTLSIGSDAGVAVGAELEVYRLKPTPTYIGHIRVVSVTPAQAVARPMTPLPGGAIQPGDRVTSKIRKEP